MQLGLLVVSAAVLFSGPVGAANLKGKASLPSNTGIHSVSQTKKYLISSFPNIKTVAYTHLPDTIWRPLYVGNVANPMGVVADPLNQRLYVADQDHHKIYWYQLIIGPDLLLKTDGHQHVAVDGVTAYWMAVNGVGDLYFSGQLLGPTASPDRAVYRMDEEKINSGDALNPTEVYTKSNSGFPNPRVWLPSGVAVDSFNVYWGNEENGKSNGAVCSGTRQNTGVTSALEINVLDKAVNEVRGMAIAADNIFYISPQAIYGATKSAWTDAEINPAVGLIQSASGSDGWDPKSIAFDGEGTMYWTEAKAGVIYQVPAGDTNPHPIQKYVDAPQVYGVTVYSLAGDIKQKKTQPNYGMLQSSAKADDSGINSSFHPHIMAMVTSVIAVLVAC